MNVRIENDNIRVEAAGIELLRLKTQIIQRVNCNVNSGKDYISFPVSSLPFVSDLLSLKVTDTGPVADLFSRFNMHAKAREKVLKIIGSGAQPTSLPVAWNDILDPAQATAVASMTIAGLIGLCLFDEQGSGKTIMTISAFDILVHSGEIDTMIVLCPKSMLDEWSKSISKFLGLTYKTVIAEGAQKRKYEAALSKFDVLISNYEGLDTMLVSLLAYASTRKCLLVIDESFNLKNSETLRSVITSRLREKCQRCFVLCGTPAPNSSHDLINQFDLADLGYTFGGFRKSKSPATDWDMISTLVDTRGVFIRRLKINMLQHVPKKNFHLVVVNLKGKQSLIYEKARADLELELRNLNNETFKKHLATYFQRRSVLLQICSCPSVIDPTFSEVPAKYSILDNLLDELISRGRKVVLWSFFTRSLDEIQSRYLKYRPVRIDGSIELSIRKEAVRSFQEDPSTMLFIGNPAAAGAGITLHAAYDAIYLSYSNQAAHYLQSLDRIHRRGQISDQVNYYLLICKGTIEEGEVARLRQKEIRQHNILGDHIPWPTSLDDALQEIGAHV